MRPECRHQGPCARLGAAEKEGILGPRAERGRGVLRVGPRRLLELAQAPHVLLQVLPVFRVDSVDLKNTPDYSCECEKLSLVCAYVTAKNSRNYHSAAKRVKLNAHLPPRPRGREKWCLEKRCEPGERPFWPQEH